MALTIDDLYASPDHYLHSFDGDAALFVPMDRAAYRRSIFLDGRIAPAGEGQMRLPVAMLTGQARQPAATAWIFHVAHCGSTLLARALDRTDGNLVLREPLALRQVAVTRDARRLAIVTAMLAKRYRPDAPTIVKANVPVNFLLPDLIAGDPNAAAIFLYLPLDDYLLAILRSDNHRGWLRNVTTLLGDHIGAVADLDDAQRAAALWLAQMRAYAAAIGRMPNARSLNAERFFAEPGAVLKAAAAHLGAPMSDGEAEAVIAGPLFATYSKDPSVAFDNAARLARRNAVATALGAEIARAQAFVDQAGGAGPIMAAIAANDLGG